MSYKCSECGATLSLRVDEINGNPKYLFCDDCLEKMLRDIFCKDLTDEDVKSDLKWIKNIQNKGGNQ